MIFLSEVQYKDLLDFACKRASPHVNCMRGPYYLLYKNLFDDAYKMGCTLIAAEKVNTPTYFENDICIIYNCEIKGIDIPENSKFVGLCFDLTDIGRINRHLLLEKDGEIYTSTYINYHLSHVYNCDITMEALINGTFRDLQLCPCGNARKLSVENFYVDNTFTCLCHDCNKSNKIHSIGNAFFDKVEEIL